MRHTEPPSASRSADTQGAVFLRMPSILRMTGLGRSTIYRLMAERKFPSSVKLGGRAIGWRRTDLDRWIEARPTVMH